MLIDLHVHTNASEGFSLSLADAIERAKARGLSGILLAECDVVPDIDAVDALAEKARFPVFVGVDVDASDGRLIAIPPDPTDSRFVEQTWRNADGDTRIADVVRVMNDLGGAVLAAHPYLDDGGPQLGDRVFRTRGLSGIEVLCGVDDDLANDLALEAAASMGLPTFGGSDTGPDGQRLGVYCTAFASEITSQPELVAAIKEGAYWPVELRKAEGRPRRAESAPRGR